MIEENVAFFFCTASEERTGISESSYKEAGKCDLR